MTILHSLSLIRAETAEDENPANTTEWIAPIRAHAKIATANSGIMGK